VALVAVRSPERPALDLIAELRGSLATRTLPIVAFGAPGLRSAAIAAGAFDYLDTPMLVRDASVVCRLWLYVRGPTADRDTVPTSSARWICCTGCSSHGAMGRTGRSAFSSWRAATAGRGEVQRRAVTPPRSRLQAFPALHQLPALDRCGDPAQLRHVPRRAQFSAKERRSWRSATLPARRHHAARQMGSLQTVFAIDARQGGAFQAGVRGGGARGALLRRVHTLGEVRGEPVSKSSIRLRVVKRLN